jgi:hypothetical protein
MKTFFASIPLFLLITACNDLQEEALPLQNPLPQVKALTVAHDYSIEVLHENVGEELCGSYPACNQMIAEVGILLQQQADLYCTPVYSCGTCCMGDDIAYVLFYKEPNPIICGETPVSSPELNFSRN